VNILCFNSGSSSLKFALYELGETEARLASGAVERSGSAPGHLWIRDARGRSLADSVGTFPEARTAVDAVLAALEPLRLGELAAVGHRVVHGGPEYATPERIDTRLVASLRRLIPFAPLHLPAEIECIESIAARFPGLPQVACFDTAFHRHLPEVAQRFPLPRRLWDEGIRRYGFHGLSYEYIVQTVGAERLGRGVIAHLGNGASMVAVRNGTPLDTTMGFTPTGGFMMGTRSGDLDPGILVYLLEHERYGGPAVERLVDHESGLLGVSGISSDMKTLLERRSADPHAAQAVEMFCYQLRKQVGALAAVLGGLDTLVFTGGIGERAAPVRWETCQGLAHLGIRLDERRNETHAAIISVPDSACTVRVVPTDEDLVIARHTRDTCRGVDMVSPVSTPSDEDRERRRKHADELLDEALTETFPASDVPAVTPDPHT
jgi:acetate kinase